jgi:hypothetical protein
MLTQEQMGGIIVEEMTIVAAESIISTVLVTICVVASIIVTAMTVLDLIFNTYIYENGSFITEDGLEYFPDGTILDKQELDKLNSFTRDN